MQTKVRKKKRKKIKRNNLGKYKLKLDYLPSKQRIWVRFSLSAMAKKTNLTSYAWTKI
jgi:hypothetical protein